MDRNDCDRCGQNVTVEFTVHDSVWERVTGNAPTEGARSGDGYWCLSCFVAVAAEQQDSDISIVIHTRKYYYEGLR